MEEMVVEHVSEETREDEGTVPVVLGGPEDDLAGYICHRLRHLEATAKHVYATSPQRDRFSPAEASVGEHIDEGSELQRSQRCQMFDLLCVEVELLASGELGQLDPGSRIRRQVAVLDRRLEDLAEDLERLTPA
ncbi:MAG TPA: hypothetical protein VF377_10150 [Acidimicrobiia bacterium]